MLQPTDTNNRQGTPQAGGMASLFGGGGGFFQGFIQLFSGLFGGFGGAGGAAGGGGFFQNILSLFGIGNAAPTAQSQQDTTRQRVINEQQADLAAKGLYPGTGKFAQDGTAGPLLQHAMRLESDPNYARQYMRSALRDPNLDAMDVMKLQASLNRLGYQAGDVDGRLDSDARRSLDRYLKEHPEDKREMPREAQERVAPRSGVIGWIKDRVDDVRSIRDHALAPSSTPGSVRGLLGIIGQHESGHNYNAVYGHSKGNGFNFTNMTVNEVLAWQRQYVREGSPSSAVGKYQIIQKTLKGLRDDMGLTGNERFTPELQDRMATRLLEQRGLNDFRSGKISAETFMNRVSREWASMPKDMSGRGYYDGDGLNRSLTGATPVLAAIEDIRRAPLPEPVRAAAATVTARAQDVDFGRPAARTNTDMGSLSGMARSAFGTASSVVNTVDRAIDSALDTARDVVTSPITSIRKWAFG